MCGTCLMNITHFTTIKTCSIIESLTQCHKISCLYQITQKHYHLISGQAVSCHIHFCQLSSLVTSEQTVSYLIDYSKFIPLGHFFSAKMISEQAVSYHIHYSKSTFQLVPFHYKIPHDIVTL